MSVPLCPRYVTAHPPDLGTWNPVFTPVVVSNLKRRQHRQIPYIGFEVTVLFERHACFHIKFHKNSVNCYRYLKILTLFSHVTKLGHPIK